MKYLFYSKAQLFYKYENLSGNGVAIRNSNPEIGEMCTSSLTSGRIPPPPDEALGGEHELLHVCVTAFGRQDDVVGPISRLASMKLPAWNQNHKTNFYDDFTRKTQRQYFDFMAILL